MPTWGQFLQELGAFSTQNPGQPLPIDAFRRNELKRLAGLTGRPTVLYASRWVQGDGSPEKIQVSFGDVQGFMEVLHSIKGPALDIILHSSGGSPTAAEAIIDYIRTRFEDVRILVPLGAMSAATMLACGANRIVMGKHSYLGPIDPQLILATPLGIRLAPAYGILQQFERARKEAGNQAQFSAWIPMLQQYGPNLLSECENAIRLSEELVKTWLAKWMFRDERYARRKAAKVARKLNAHDEHLAHGRFLNREVIKSIGLYVEDLEADQNVQDALLSVLHMTTHTFSLNVGAQKIIENHEGKAFVTFASPKP